MDGETRLHITALGSSFAAGPGIQPKANPKAGRSANNYAHLLASRLGAELTDLTVSGATLPNILNEPQVLRGNHFEPQLNNFPANTDIVTMTAGGNDIGYIGGISRDTLQQTFWGKLLLYFVPIPDAPIHTSEEVAERIIRVIDAIYEKAPDCKIFLVEYLTVLGENTRPGIDVYLNEERVRHHQRVAQTLSNGYELAAKARRGVQVIPVSKESFKHGIGQQDAWVEGMSLKTIWNGNPLHPNLKGMQVVADMLYNIVKAPTSST